MADKANPSCNRHHAQPTCHPTDRPAAAFAPPGAPRDDDGTVLPQSGYVTSEFVKRYFQISNSTLYKHLKEKKFPPGWRIPGTRAVRWRAEDLRAFEASLEVADTATKART